MSNDQVENHNKGQKDGSKGNIVTDIHHDLSRLGKQTAHRKGYENGMKNRPKK